MLEPSRRWVGFPGASLQLAATVISSMSSQSGSAAEPSLPPALVTGFGALNNPCLSAACQPSGGELRSWRRGGETGATRLLQKSSPTPWDCKTR